MDKETFYKGKSAEELMIDTTRTFEVVIPNMSFSKGEKITLKSYSPYKRIASFWKEDKTDYWSIEWHKLRYADYVSPSQDTGDKSVPIDVLAKTGYAIECDTEADKKRLLEALNGHIKWLSGCNPTEYITPFRYIIVSENLGRPALTHTATVPTSYTHISCNDFIAMIKEEKVHDETNKHNIIKKVMNYAKEKTMRLYNPELYALYKAGYTDENGNLTQKGRDVNETLKDDLVRDRLVATAKEELEEKRSLIK